MLLAALAAASALGQDPLAKLLPAEAQAPGWSRDGLAQEFAGQDLYAYMDGGAEIYQEYGFVRAIVQDYSSGKGRSISLEIFEMETPAAAYGIFTLKRSGKGKAVGPGGTAELEDYYLNLWKGRYLVTLTGFDGEPETVAGLLALARAVEARITNEAEPPALVTSLPGPGLLAGSVKFIKGPLGLNNLYPFGLSRGLHFEAAVKGDYEDGSSLIILDYGSAGTLAGEWKDLLADLEEAPKFKAQGSTKGGRALFKDDKDRFLAIAVSDQRLLVGLGPSAASAQARTGRSY